MFHVVAFKIFSRLRARETAFVCVMFGSRFTLQALFEAETMPRYRMSQSERPRPGPEAAAAVVRDRGQRQEYQMVGVKARWITARQRLHFAMIESHQRPSFCFKGALERRVDRLPRRRRGISSGPRTRSPRLAPSPHTESQMGMNADDGCPLLPHWSRN